MRSGRPTDAMIRFAKILINQLGYDPDDYDFDNMTFAECSNLIDELKAERDG
jgi:hypothetical protein